MLENFRANVLNKKKSVMIANTKKSLSQSMCQPTLWGSPFQVLTPSDQAEEILPQLFEGWLALSTE